MPVKPLPPNPSLDHLKHQAKDLLKAHASHAADIARRLREFHPRFARATDAQVFAADFKLSDAQLTIAREHGFSSWPRMKQRIEKPTLADRLDLPHHERIEDATFRRAVDLLDAGDVDGLRDHLMQHPKVAEQRVDLEGTNYFRHPTLLEFIAENPTRRGSLPKNIVEVGKVILDAGTTQAALDETLALVASSMVARDSGAQRALIDLLCDHGADSKRATRVAAIHGEFDAVEQLLQRGARLDLATAAALGRADDVRRLLTEATSDERHWALAVASQFGHAEIVRMLLEAGEDPNRYSPVGGHSHATPLHQAALAGHLDVVQLLVEHGAKLDWRDAMWEGTPAGWAHHAGKTDVERYLRKEEDKQR
jgi:Ankyrin repeats (3 copies)